MKRVMLTAVLTAVACISGNVFAVLSGGGTEANPYLIQSRADFDEFANPANAAAYWASGVYTKLMCDLDLSGTTYAQAVIAPDTSTSSGFQGTQFTGIFDGNGHTIRNVIINLPQSYWVGLFGYVGQNGNILNLLIEDVQVTGKDRVAGLAGELFYGVVTNCNVSGTVTGNSNAIGGLVGFNNDGLVTKCGTSCTVRSEGDNVESIGGLVGTNDWYATMSFCYAASDVNYIGTNSRVGGLAGTNYGIINNCYSSGNVNGYQGVGGLVGVNFGDPVSHIGAIDNCYATGNVNGQLSLIGGLVGYNNDAAISSSYASGMVSGGVNVGGLVGFNDPQGNIGTSYSTGKVVGQAPIGGLVGQNYSGLGIVNNCFWDTVTSGQTTSDGGTGKTTADMKTFSTFTSANWDFVNVWGIGNGQTYPYLKSFNEINPADMDYSGTVDIYDFVTLAANWLETVEY